MTRFALGLAAIVVLASGGRPAMAYYCKDGQQPVPPAVAARMALPLCGFAADKRWGPNGCQLCDSSNMYPNPFSYQAPDDHAARRARRYRASQ